jgi:hypothetical protein
MSTTFIARPASACSIRVRSARYCSAATESAAVTEISRGSSRAPSTTRVCCGAGTEMTGALRSTGSGSDCGGALKSTAAGTGGAGAAAGASRVTTSAGTGSAPRVRRIEPSRSARSRICCIRLMISSPSA